MSTARGPKSQSLPLTGAIDRGEIHGLLEEGHCLVWLHPLPAPLGTRADAKEGLHYVADAQGRHTLIIDLWRHPRLTLARDAVEAPALEPRDGHLAIRVPSTEAFLDVSRSPLRLEWREAEGLSVTTSSDRGVLWIGLSECRGRLGQLRVTEWAALGVGPVVLWYVPRPVGQAQALVTPATPEAAPEATPGAAPGATPGTASTATPGAAPFLALSASSRELVLDVQRRARRRVEAPPTAGLAPFSRAEGFLLAGETGVGKNVLARAARPEALCQGRFVTVQPEEVRGWIDLVPFYGAQQLAHDGQRVRDQAGRLEVLTEEDGVLLFDEIHSLDEEFRYRLLELLTYFTFRPRGDSGRVRPIRGLVLFATSRLAEVRDPGRFPSDLYFRMGGDANLVVVPPLSERRWEIPGLAEAVLARLWARGGAEGAPARLSAEARRKLLLHDWPGNFRELEQCLVEALSLCGPGVSIRPEQLKVGPPAALSGPARRGARGVDALDADLAKPAQEPPPAHSSPSARDPGAGPGLPDRLRWTDLFCLLERLPDRAALTEALLAHRQRRGLGGANVRSVNKEIGRLVQCDRFPRPGCERCFACRLVTGGGGEVVKVLSRSSAAAGLRPDAALALLSRGVDRLVVDRLGQGEPAWETARTALRAAQDGPLAALEQALDQIGALLQNPSRD